MKYKLFGIVAGVALLAGACSDRNLIDTVEGMTPVEPGFKAQLHEQYILLAKSESVEGDIFDAGTFARQAEAAAMGKDVQPDSLWDRDFTDANRLAVHRERGRLVYALDSGGREGFPDLASTAQSQFDCWVQELEENYQPDDIKACHDGYNAAITALEAAMKPKPVAAQPAPQPAIQVTQKFLLFFDFDSARLTGDAKEIVQALSDLSKQVPVTSIVATGHADRSGPDSYNLALSERRVIAVRSELLRLGLPGDLITVEWKGEREPLVQTNDGAREPQNRRVEILMK